MDASATGGSEIRPRLLRRLSGGWLAVSPEGSSIHIGVEGSSPEEAEERFNVEWRAWEILRTDVVGHR